MAELYPQTDARALKDLLSLGRWDPSHMLRAAYVGLPSWKTDQRGWANREEASKPLSHWN